MFHQFRADLDQYRARIDLGNYFLQFFDRQNRTIFAESRQRKGPDFAIDIYRKQCHVSGEVKSMTGEATRRMFRK
jgi:hypothetical protein